MKQLTEELIEEILKRHPDSAPIMDQLRELISSKPTGPDYCDHGGYCIDDGSMFYGFCTRCGKCLG